MKKSHSILCLGALLALASCNDDKSSPATPQPGDTYTITLETNGGAKIAPLVVEKNKPITNLPTPSKKDANAVFDLAFDSWYTDPGLTKPFSPSAPITGNTMLYAKYRTDTYLISTADQLEALAEEDFLKGSYKLQADIDLQGKPWTPIGRTSTASFSGTLDGDGHVVKNLHIDEPAGIQDVGLIGVNSGVVKNIGVEVSPKGIKGGGAQHTVGVLVGWNITREGQPTAIVEGYATGGTVSGAYNVGGLVGLSEETVKGHVAQIQITSSQGNTGGLVGEARGNVHGYAVGITVTSAGNRVGGLVGLATGSVYGYVEGDISGSSFIGGLVGDTQGNVYGYAKGTVSGAQGVGGLVGHQNSSLIQGYARVKVVRTGGGANADFGLLVGTLEFFNFSRGQQYAYQSDKESKFDGGVMVKGVHSADGDPITISPGTGQSAFPKITNQPLSSFYFKANEWPQWTFAAGRWPAINLPAEVGGKYKPADQPTAP